MALLANMPMRNRLMLGGAAVGVLIVAFMLLKLATAPSYSLVATGLDPAKTGKMTATLDAQGITYELRNNGTALAVAKGKTAQARIALAGAGLSSGTPTQPGFELLDKQKLGASNFQQKIAYQRALEGQIAQTIGQVSGISGAQVQLTMPDDQLFASEQKPTTAAVLLSGDTSSLEPAAVKGIASLVASSVEGLKTQDVTITDSSGTLVWPTGDAAGGAASKPAADARYAAAMAGSLNAMLTRTLGPNKAEVQVNADLDVDQTSLDKLAYAKKGVPAETTTDVETLKGKGGAAAGGASGTAANIPSYASGGSSGSGGDSNYKHTTGTTKFALNKTVQHTTVAPGAVQQLNVAAVFDKSVPKPEVAAMKAAISSAAGLQPKRGDTLSVSQVAFAKQPAAAPPASGLPAGGMLGMAKYAGLGLASLLFLFFLSRHLRKRESEVLVEPAWLRQLDKPTPLAELERGMPAPQLAAPVSVRRQQVEDVAKREPERVATAVRAWMGED